MKPPKIQTIINETRSQKNEWFPIKTKTLTKRAESFCRLVEFLVFNSVIVLTFLRKHRGTMVWVGATWGRSELK